MDAASFLGGDGCLLPSKDLLVLRLVMPLMMTVSDNSFDEALC